MKKILLLLAFFSLGALADDWSFSKVYRYNTTDTNSGSPGGTYNFSYSNDSVSVQLAYARQIHAVPYQINYDSLKYGALTPSTSLAYSHPFFSYGSGKYIPITQAPILYFLDLLAARLVFSGFTFSPDSNFNVTLTDVQVVTTNGNTVLYNLRSFNVVNAALVSTNTLWRSSVLSALDSLDNSLKASVANSLSAVDQLGALLSSYLSANRFNIGLSTNFLEFANDYYLGSGLFGDDMSSQIADNILEAGRFGSPEASIDYFNAIRGGYSSLLQDSYKAYFQTVRENPSSVRSSTLQDLIDHPAKAQEILSSSYSTPLTNAMKRMTADWRDAVTNELAQNTANITNQLQQWKRDSKLNHNDITNALDKVGLGVSAAADDAKRVADMLSGSSASKAHVIVDNVVDVNVMNWPEEMHININANDLDILAKASGLSTKELLDNLTNRVDALTNSVASLPVSLDVITNLLAKIDVDMLDNLTNLDFNVSLTNELWNYYFTRFRRANEFEDENGQRFRVDSAADSIFGNGFDVGEFSNLNWFSRVEVLLYQVGRVFDSTNAIESVDIESALDDSVDQLEEHGADFVAASRRVVGLFSLVDRFAKSMKLAFGSYSNPVTSGIVLLPSGSWIGSHALVLEIPVSVQNALRLVFQCIWYCSAFVVGWLVVSSVWSRVVSFVRWLWSLIDL